MSEFSENIFETAIHLQKKIEVYLSLLYKSALNGENTVFERQMILTEIKNEVPPYQHHIIENGIMEHLGKYGEIQQKLNEGKKMNESEKSFFITIAGMINN